MSIGISSYASTSTLKSQVSGLLNATSSYITSTQTGSMTCGTSSYSTTSSFAITTLSSSYVTPSTNVSLRGSNGFSFSGLSSIGVTFSPNSSSGDLVVISVGSSLSINTPTGWTASGVSSVANSSGGVYSKILDATDMLSGSVTFTFGGSVSCCLCAIEFVGATAGIRDVTSYHVNTTPNTVVANPQLTSSIVTTDSIIYHVYNSKIIAGPGFVGISRGDIINAPTNGLGATSFERVAPNGSTVSVFPMTYMTAPTSGYYYAATTIKSV